MTTVLSTMCDCDGDKIELIKHDFDTYSLQVTSAGSEKEPDEKATAFFTLHDLKYLKRKLEEEIELGTFLKFMEEYGPEALNDTQESEASKEN